MRNDWDKELAPFLDAGELASVTERQNSATHLLLAQGRTLTAFQNAGRIDLFHQIQLMGMIGELYALQGKAERIKHPPFPRQYAEHSRWFTRVFALMVPLGMLDVFAANDVPMSALCRTIEIDLREMLGETDLPEKEQVIDDILY